MANTILYLLKTVCLHIWHTPHIVASVRVYFSYIRIWPDSHMFRSEGPLPPATMVKGGNSWEQERERAQREERLACLLVDSVYGSPRSPTAMADTHKHGSKTTRKTKQNKNSKTRSPCVCVVPVTSWSIDVSFKIKTFTRKNCLCREKCPEQRVFLGADRSIKWFCFGHC